MKTKSGFRGRSIHECGVALVIVLALIVLLTGVIVAFFSRATSSRKLSDSSLNQNAAEQLGRSALDVITGDLRQEIAVGSTLTNSVYLPLSNTNAVPIRSGVPGTNASGQDLIPNLIRRSVRSDSIQTPGVGSRASAVNATDISANSRLISLDRWNNHYLIPLSTTPTTPTSPTPISDFVAPDWVYVTENGPTVLTAVPAASDPAVIGRYAYAIYDEGGLLDVNVAGFPSGLTTIQGGRKGTLALADLTKVGLQQQDVDNLVGWRNYASSAAGGTFPTFTPTASNYYNYVTTNTNGFLTVNPLVSATGKTDQIFPSRQALIAFQKAEGFPQASLQYLGTFSRDLEQPSFIPNSKRPAVQSGPFTNQATFGTGNSDFGLDRKSASANDPTDINPPFLMVTYKRAGEFDATPVALKRFPLSRLGKVASTSTSNQSASDFIYSNFGLSRGNASSAWTYNHGDSTKILTLSEVAAQGRDPDFFELLKAAINVGSIGKGAWYDASYQGGTVNGFAVKSPRNDGSSDNASTTQLRRDSNVDLQIIQIGANLIDQYDADSFPTRIQLGANAVISGVEDLPYMYRIHSRPVRTVDSWTGNDPTTNLPLPAPVPATRGVFLLEPDLWNPHAANNNGSSDGPTNFRFRVVPDSTVTSDDLVLRLSWATGNPIQFPSHAISDIANSYLTFNAGEKHGFYGFREPTLLAESSHPSLSNLGAAGSFTEFKGGRTLVGINVGDFPWYSSLALPLDAKWRVTQVDVGDPLSNPAHNVPNTLMHCYLDYQDSGGAWISYDEQDMDLFYYKDLIATVDQNEWMLPGSNGEWMSAVRVDPRTSRWGVVHSDSEGGPIGALSSAGDYAHSTERPSAALAYGARQDYLNDLGIPGATSIPGTARFASNPTLYLRGLLRGYFQENNFSAELSLATSFTGGSSVYMRDPDGIARRAIGGYATDSASSGSTGDGLPMTAGNTRSRPIILNRPFRSVGEMGYAFSDSIWKNIDFSFPESGYSALLDVFCVNETPDSSALVAGRVNLNTRQRPVLQALLAGALQDENATGVLSDTDVSTIADALVKCTTSTVANKGPLANRSELVGRYVGSGGSTADPSAHYAGFSSDLGAAISNSTNSSRIPRMREVAVRALVDAGTTRTWNLLIDVVAQTGKFAPGVTDLKKFTVSGERRIWLHVAIDRLTGKILDKQVEIVKE